MAKALYKIIGIVHTAIGVGLGESLQDYLMGVAVFLYYVLHWIGRIIQSPRDYLTKLTFFFVLVIVLNYPGDQSLQNYYLVITYINVLLLLCVETCVLESRNYLIFYLVRLDAI